MDGVPGIAQCGIPVGHNFTCKLTLNRSGTFWWHSHYRTQRANGLFGAMIIEDVEEKKYCGFVL